MKSLRKGLCLLLTLLMLLSAAAPVLAAPEGDTNLSTGATIVSHPGAGAQEGVYPPSKAIDGDTSSYWDGGDYPADVVINLGGWYKLSEIRIFNHTARSYQYRIETSVNNIEYKTAEEQLEDVPETDEGKLFDIASQDITAKYVRITVLHNTANKASHLKEVEIWGHEDTGFSVAPGEIKDRIEMADGLDSYRDGGTVYNFQPGTTIRGVENYPPEKPETLLELKVSKTFHDQFAANGITSSGNPLSWTGGSFTLEITDILGRTETLELAPTSIVSLGEEWVIYRFPVVEAGYTLQRGNIYSVKLYVLSDSTGLQWVGQVGGITVLSDEVYKGGEVISDGSDVFDPALVEKYAQVPLVRMNTYGKANIFEKRPGGDVKDPGNENATEENVLVMTIDPKKLPHGIGDIAPGNKVAARIDGKDYTGSIYDAYGYIGPNVLIYVDLNMTQEDVAALAAKTNTAGEGAEATTEAYFEVDLTFSLGETPLFRGLFAGRTGTMSTELDGKGTTKIYRADSSEGTLSALDEDVAAAAAANPVYTAGEGVSAIVTEAGDLLFRGKGSIAAVATAEDAPWNDKVDAIKRVILSYADISAIGDNVLTSLLAKEVPVIFCGSEEEWGEIDLGNNDVTPTYHDVQVWNETQQPSHEHVGTKEGKCELCGETLTQEFGEIIPYEEGDISGDDKVDIEDVTALLQCLTDPAGAEGYDRADLTGDSHVTIRDVSRLLLLLSKQ